MDYSANKGQVVTEVEFITQLPITDMASIILTLVAERKTKSPNVEPTISRRATVNLTCK
jgi:hypothetical protein